MNLGANMAPILGIFKFEMYNVCVTHKDERSKKRKVCDSQILY